MILKIYKHNWNKMPSEFWSDREVEELGFDPKDGTLCRFRNCACGWCVDDVLKRKGIGPTSGAK